MTRPSPAQPARRSLATQNPLARPSPGVTRRAAKVILSRAVRESAMRRQTLRTPVWRFSAFAILLVSFACCGGSTETVEEASEAMMFIPPLNPSPRLTVAPTNEELARATSEMEQFVRDNL